MRTPHDFTPDPKRPLVCVFCRKPESHSRHDMTERPEDRDNPRADYDLAAKDGDL